MRYVRYLDLVLQPNALDDFATVMNAFVLVPCYFGVKRLLQVDNI